MLSYQAILIILGTHGREARRAAATRRRTSASLRGCLPTRDSRNLCTLDSEEKSERSCRSLTSTWIFSENRRPRKSWRRRLKRPKRKRGRKRRRRRKRRKRKSLRRRGREKTPKVMRRT